MGGINLLAADAAPTMQGVFTTALNTIQSDVMGYIAIALPVALGIVGAFFGIKKAISFFKSTAK